MVWHIKYMFTVPTFHMREPYTLKHVLQAITV